MLCNTIKLVEIVLGLVLLVTVLKLAPYWDSKGHFMYVD
jgi:hypothetical protein